MSAYGWAIVWLLRAASLIGFAYLCWSVFEALRVPDHDWENEAAMVLLVAALIGGVLFAAFAAAQALALKLKAHKRPLGNVQ